MALPPRITPAGATHHPTPLPKMSWGSVSATGLENLLPSSVQIMQLTLLFSWEGEGQPVLMACLLASAEWTGSCVPVLKAPPPSMLLGTAWLY